MKNGDLATLKDRSGSWAAGTPVTVVHHSPRGVSVTMPNLETYLYSEDELEPVALYEQPAAREKLRMVSAVSQMLDLLAANLDAPCRAVFGECKAIAEDLGYRVEG